MQICVSKDILIVKKFLFPFVLAQHVPALLKAHSEKDVSYVRPICWDVEFGVTWENLLSGAALSTPCGFSL